MQNEQRRTAPIFLIGAARSGTTLIADVLASHPDIAYWVEPRYVWRYGNPGAMTDIRSAGEATPGIVAHIRQQFEDYRMRLGRPRFLEKTPSNCFRIPFIYRAFPEGLFIHVERDGRDAAASALKRWRSPPDDGAIWRRIRRWEIPFAELHHYVPHIIREAILRRLRPNRGFVWGPRYAGLESDLAQHLSTPTLCARQWAESAQTAVRELARLPKAQVFSFRYEEFVRNPTPLLSAMLDFAGLSADASLFERARREVKNDRIGGFANLTEAEQGEIEAICGPVMAELTASAREDGVDASQSESPGN